MLTLIDSSYLVTCIACSAVAGLAGASASTSSLMVPVASVSAAANTGSGDSEDKEASEGLEKEILIPAVREFIKKIDLEEDEILIDPIEGLLDLK